MPDRLLSERLDTPEQWDRRVQRYLEEPDDVLCVWGSQASHDARLRAAMLYARGSVLDVGCGPGKLLDLMPDPLAYCGIDTSHEMIVQAKARRPHGSFSQMAIEDVDWSADWVVSIGVVQVLESSAHQWQFLEECWKRANAGMAISLLHEPAVGRRAVRLGELARVPTGLPERPRKWLVDTTYLPNDALLVCWR